MLDQVSGAREAERDFHAGKREFIGTARSGRLLVGIGGDDVGLLFSEPKGCEVTWEGRWPRESMGAFLNLSAEEIDALPTDVPRGSVEISCDPDRGGPPRLIARLVEHYCIVFPRDKGYNERMLRLIMASRLVEADA